jgi:hypothetical protein
LANHLLGSSIEVTVSRPALAVFVATTVAGCAAATVQRPGVTVYENRGNSSMTEGDTAIDCDPDMAFKESLDYTKWPRIFSDIRTAIITATDGDDARVTFVHTNGDRDNLHFHNHPAERQLWFEDTGDDHATVWAEITFLPGPRPGTTRVHSRLYADVTGIASLFVTGGHLRALREQRVQHDLLQIHAYFNESLARAR